MKFSIHQASHIGGRKYNQDRAAYAYTNDALLLVLADGMGGHLHGELAASLIVETFVETFGRDAQQPIADPYAFISNTMHHANDRIMKVTHDNTMGGFPGSTCVAVLIQDGEVFWGHAGDSRLYLLRCGAVLAKTNDHSMVQEWINRGLITADQARIHPQRNQITNCLGGIQDMFYIEPGKQFTLQSNDVLLLCSDGLWGSLTDQELAAAFVSRPVTDTLNDLITVAVAREGGSADNATGIAVRWGTDETDHVSANPVCKILEIA